jgi:hypothetical protein
MFILNSFRKQKERNKSMNKERKKKKSPPERKLSESLTMRGCSENRKAGYDLLAGFFPLLTHHRKEKDGTNRP